MAAMHEFTVQAQYDDEAGVWRASNAQLPFTTEAPTLDGLLARVTEIASEMAAESGLVPAGERLKIHLVADRVAVAAVSIGVTADGEAHSDADASAPVSFADLQIALEFVSSGGLGENQAVLDRHSGRILWHSELADGSDEDFPDDIDDERYIEIPHKKELDLGTPLVFDFIREFYAGDYDEVRRIFSRKGAYRRFKDFLVRRGALDRWHDFSNKAEEAALRGWCADNAIEIVD
jgi:hypothetical protein